MKRWWLVHSNKWDVGDDKLWRRYQWQWHVWITFLLGNLGLCIASLILVLLK